MDQAISSEIFSKDPGSSLHGWSEQGFLAFIQRSDHSVLDRLWGMLTLGGGDQTLSSVIKMIHEVEQQLPSGYARAMFNFRADMVKSRPPEERGQFSRMLMRAKIPDLLIGADADRLMNPEQLIELKRLAFKAVLTGTKYAEADIALYEDYLHKRGNGVELGRMLEAESNFGAHLCQGTDVARIIDSGHGSRISRY